MTWEDTLTATATYTDPQDPDHTASGDSANAVAADTRNKAPAFAADQDPDTEGASRTRGQEDSCREHGRSRLRGRWRDHRH